jgi:hypothetical protein
MRDEWPELQPADSLAGRASRDPSFLGWALAAHQRQHGLDDAGLAAELSCAPDALTAPHLCRRPGVAAPGLGGRD